MNWISVKDEKPIEGVRILFYDEFHGITIGYFETLDIKSTVYRWEDKWSNVYEDVTHWMALPELPKED